MVRIRRQVARFALPLVVAAAVMTGWGCSQTSVQRLRADPTPALDAAGWTKGQMKNVVAVESDHHLRAIHDDFLRAMLLIDRGNLSYTPIP